MRSWVLCIVAAAPACSDAIVLTVASDRPVPTALDSMCLGIAGGNGQVGRRYPLDALPQTLRVEAGSADAAIAWVRGDRGGVPVARAQVPIDFSGDVTLALDRCVVGPSPAPTARGTAGPANARLVASMGAGGNIVVALGVTASVIDADGAHAAPPLPAGDIVAAISIDLDGDCDDDVVLATTGAAPTIWRRDGATFVDAGTIGDAPVAALAAADVDGDGAIDLIMGAGAQLAVWRNDGSGTFVPSAGAITSTVTELSGLAAGDLDGDGRPDLIASDRSGPLAAWLGTGGAFAASPGIVPEVQLDGSRMQLVDVDGDLDLDLVAGAPLRLFVNRDGLLEDQTFVRLGTAPAGAAFAIGGWDAGCEPDLAASGAIYAGQPGGAFAREADAPVATDIVLVELDDDGDLDAVYATADGVTWLAR